MSGVLEHLTLDTISFTLVVKHGRPTRYETIRVHADEQDGAFSLHEMRRTACNGKIQFLPMKAIPLDCHDWKAACEALVRHMTTLLSEVDYYETTLFDVLQERYGEKADIVELHTALDNLLALFVSQHGYDYSAVDDALKALARTDLPVTLAFAERIAQIRKEQS